MFVIMYCLSNRKLVAIAGETIKNSLLLFQATQDTKRFAHSKMTTVIIVLEMLLAYQFVLMQLSMQLSC